MSKETEGIRSLSDMEIAPKNLNHVFTEKSTYSFSARQETEEEKNVKMDREKLKMIQEKMRNVPDSFDSTAIPLQDSDDKGYLTESPDDFSSFSGCDTIVSCNFRIINSIQSLSYDVNGAGVGTFVISEVVMADIPPKLDHQTLVLVFENEYGRTAFMKVALGDLLSVKSDISVDVVITRKASWYKGTIVKDMQPIPETVQNLTGEDIRFLKNEIIALLPPEKKNLYENHIQKLNNSLNTKVVLTEALADLLLLK